jgi:hypothetical protein
MVRNLMLILGLSLTLAAFGCSDDDDNGGSGGTAGDGGAGGEGGSAGEGGSGGAEGACTNEADTAIVCDAGFTAAVTACGTSNIGAGAEAIATCVADDTGTSAECATCFGETTQCTIDNCIQAGCAADPMGEECTNCRAENCDEAFNACAGAFDCGA